MDEKILDKLRTCRINIMQKPVEIKNKGTVIEINPKNIKDCILSFPAWNKINKSLGFCRDRKRKEKNKTLPYRGYKESYLLSYEEHLRRLGLNRKNVLINGVRNLGNNLRIVGWSEKYGLFQLRGESATSGREYTCLCKTKTGDLKIERLSFNKKGKPNLKNLFWAVSGQELVWNGKPNPIEKIIPYTYDLRHIWKIPGIPVKEMGPKPYAGPAIEEMEDAFVKWMKGNNEKMASSLMELAEEKGYKKEQDYLHNAIGIKKDGKIIIFHQKGSFEEISKALVKISTWKAIEIQEGGSCEVISRGKVIFSSDYFRPKAL